MSDHSSLGASGSRRWMNCLGSINLSKQAPPDKGSVYADAGTAAHEIMERCLINSVRPELFLDTVIQTDDMRSAVTVDEEMCEAVTVLLDYVYGRQELGAKLLGVEVKFDLSPLNPPGPMYGRADVVLQDPGTKPQRSVDHNGNIRVIMPKPGILEVVDFKYGQGTIVDVVENSQLMYYALGAVVATDRIPNRVRITVIQPRAPHPNGIVRSWEFDYPELKAFKQLLFERAAASMEEDAPLTPGDWCKFCSALAICPAQHERAQLVAQTEFSQVAIDVSVDLETVLPIPAALTLERLQEVMIAAPVYDAWIAAVRNHVRELTEAGEETGYKLVPKRGRRMWVDADRVEYQAMRMLGAKAFVPQKLKSVTQIEKSLKAVGGTLPKDWWEMVSSGSNLVPLDDPREALPPPASARDDFEEYTEADEAAEVAAVLGVELVEDPLAESLELTQQTPTHGPETFDGSEQEDATEITVEMWMIEAGDKSDMFFVEANSEAEAREVARADLGVARLPNHTRVTPA